MFLNTILLISGFTVLIFGADWLVNGASGLAKRLNVPDLVIGLTVVAFGTSAPELVVNLVAAFEGSSDIALTNILGSNIINVLIILGVSAVIAPLASQRSSRKVEIPLSILAGIIVLPMGIGLFGTGNEISRIDGIVLLLIFGGFLLYQFRNAKSNANASESFKPMALWKAILLIVVGLAGLVVGGQLVVKSAVKMAEAWGVSQSIIGVTIVALGTSLPELATSAIAAYKRNADLAIGNVIGSNIFNVFMVLGISSVIHPLTAYANLAIDAAIAAGSCLLVWIFVLTNKRHEIKRWQGGILLICYAAYLTWLLSTI